MRCLEAVSLNIELVKVYFDQSTFTANNELGQSEYDVCLLDISVEEQSVLSKNTSECYHKVIT